ncbi:2,3-bisphosphoglycerate-independent phosphoglycerate mutase [Bacteroidales bacterium OttesenSCG-928-K03]|nr:2,3-bisphosphoglycerate-independent phosphoglycerate mutase [Odoribacter sp. OttesenSCG-928-L07]MDL2239733.1 2,3-bisphosphoglycerate-independent phosphoglycerate mutase [Bacteroidales bacterium OttesenSCG-928-L14]MDL2242447.1 2,3-bisphosphoglycerate-independent phosphoglycerate mutase [Bacteroidales bacterium OttesenSCG-928-K03]
MQKVLLMILDGWGIGDGSKADVISNTPTPNIDRLTKKYPHATLKTSGEDVGLPEGQMGNSEVGHLNIGAGRVVYQDLVRINKACEDNSITKIPTIVDAMNYAKENNVAIHFIGLVSDGCVHSSDKHLYKLCDITKEYGIEDVFIHAITDGRDTDPHSGLGFIKNLNKHLETSNGKIATVAGRYYTMDRDKRWERVKRGYDAMVNGIGIVAHSAEEAIEKSYVKDVTDEFIIPTVILDDNNKPIACIKDNDVVISFNFRNDRARQYTRALTQEAFPEYDMKPLNLYYLTMTPYDDTFKNLHVIFDKEHVHVTLGEVVSKNLLRQIRIAETEKYAHVTFFFNGGVETEFPGEKRILIPSPKVATYDLQPEMSAYEVKNAIVEEINNESADFICLNFANGDMVGHTGVYSAIQKAITVVDECVGEIVDASEKHDYTVIIIADHGNADYALNSDGSPNTAHSLNVVPIILVSDKYTNVNDGRLSDIAPTILKIMGIEIPKEMTGNILV